MSRDFRIGHRCPHLVVEEPVALGSDRRELRPTASISGANLVRILANNEFYIPPSGLYSQATLRGSRSGPFRIEGCTAAQPDVDNNILTVSSSTETQTFRLPIGLRVKTDDLVKVFRDRFTDIVVVNDNGYLAFTDVANIGRESRIRVEGRAAESLGFGDHFQNRGRLLYPPWRLIKKEDQRINPRLQGDDLFISERFPQFSAPVRTNPTFKVTYTARPDRCPRCRGTFVENDWRFDPQGDPIFIENEDLLYQAALKILLTERGSNPFHQRYGSQLLSRIGTKVVGATATLISEDVRTALNRMQKVQRAQSKYQKVTLRERLYNILSVTTSPHRNDPTAYLVDVVVSNGSGQPVQLGVVFSVPGAVALAGTNNLSLGLDTTGLSDGESRNVFR